MLARSVDADAIVLCYKHVAQRIDAIYDAPNAHIEVVCVVFRISENQNFKMLAKFQNPPPAPLYELFFVYVYQHERVFRIAKVLLKRQNSRLLALKFRQQLLIA